MLFWVLNIGVFAVYSFILNIKSKKNNVYLVIALIHLSILIIFRDISVGTDTRSYSMAYELLYKTGSAGKHVMTTAPFFYQYMKYVAKVWPYKNGYILFTAFPTMLCLAYFLKKQGDDYFNNIYLYCVCYFYFYSMNAARQFLAMGVIMICYCLTQAGRKMGAWLLFLCACAIHSTSVIFGIFLIANLIKWNSKRLMGALILILTIMPLLPMFMTLFIKIYPQYNFLLNKVFAEKYTSQGRASMVYAICCIVAVTIEVLGIMYEEKKLSILIGGKEVIGKPYNMDEIYGLEQKSCELVVLVFTCGCIFLFYPTSILFWRMAYTGFLFIILLLPRALSRIMHGNLICTTIMYMPLLIIMLMQIVGNYSNVRDYAFYIFS